MIIIVKYINVSIIKKFNNNDEKIFPIDIFTIYY